MPIGLGIVDNKDGSGAVATISGAGGAETVFLFAYTFTGDNNIQMTTAFTSSRVGNGTISAAVEIGNYIWSAVGVSTSALVKQNVTDGSQPVHYRILNAVAARVAAIGFTSWLPSNKIFVRWASGRQSISKDGTPAVYVCPIGQESYIDVVLNRDDIGYPVAILLVDLLQNNAILNLARGLDFRARVAKSLRNQRLPDVPEVYLANIYPDVICDPGAYAANVLVSAVVFRFFIREGRGI